MRLVDVLVHRRVVLGAMDPVDEGIGKDKKEWHAQDQVREAVLIPVLVHPRVPAHLRDEPRHGQHIKHRKRIERRLDLELDLVLEEPRVLQEVLVEEEVIGHRSY